MYLCNKLDGLGQITSFSDWAFEALYICYYFNIQKEGVRSNGAITPATLPIIPKATP